MEDAPPAWLQVSLQFLPLALILLLVAYPASRVLRKAGFSPWFSLLVLIPPVAVFGLWLLAFMRWPALDNADLSKVFDDAGSDSGSGSSSLEGAPPFLARRGDE